jgi:hypothetical protein
MKRVSLVLVVGICVVAVSTTAWWATTRRPAVSVTAENVAPLPQSTPPAITSPLSKYLTQRKAEVVQETLSTLNQQPIEFYGQVIDQYNSPVSGAMVHGQVIYNTGPASGILKQETMTDNTGAFEFKGLQGRTFDLNIVKPGYQFMPEGDGFDYSKLVSEQRRHHPDPAKPVVFKMWKLQGGVALISKTKSFDLPADGTLVRIDLVTGSIAQAAGDLLIILKHGTEPSGRAITKYDWTAELVAVDGGLREERCRLTNMFEAPVDGYVPSIMINMPASAANWSRTYSRNFYMKTRGNIHSRIGVDIHTIPSGGSSYVSLKWWLNPTAESRNLEGDEGR